MRRYLAGFGPATRADVASFTGLPPGTVRTVLERLELRRFRSEDGARSCSTCRARRCPTPTRRRRRASCRPGTRRSSSTPAAPACCPRTYRPRLFSIRNPHSNPTFLVDGAVAGAGASRTARSASSPWEKLDRADERALREEADRLAAFHA